MKYLIPFVFCILTGSTFAQKSFVHQLFYTIDLSRPESGFANIELRYTTKKSDSTVFLLPSNWGETSKLTYFSHLSVNHTVWKINSDSTQLTCYHKPGSELVINYRIDNGIKDSMAGPGEIYFLHLKPTYFSAFSNGLLLAVEDSNAIFSSMEVKFLLPERWKTVVSNFGEGRVLKTGKIANGQVQNGYFLAGDYRVHRVKTATHQELTFCIRGSWSFTDQELLDETVQILDQQRKFWNDFTTRKFFISLTPGLSLNERSVSYTGTGLMNAFVMNATNNQNVTPLRLRYLLNHELMHHWIGGKIENSADEELSYWFSEGFTDYFARLNMKSSGSVTEQEYRNMLDSIFKVHYASPYREYHNDSIKVHFWDNRQIEKIPYNRGSIFALYLDNLIQKTTNGQKDLTLVMRKMIGEVLASHHNKRFDRSWFSELVRNTTGIDPDPLLDRYIINGELIAVDTFNRVLQSQLQMTEMSVFDFGFISTKLGEGKEIISQIIPNSGAQEAGLQVGDTITGYDMYFDPGKEGRVRVVRNSEEKWVSYFPYKKVIVPQFKKE